MEEKIQAFERVLVGHIELVSTGGTCDVLPDVLGLEGRRVIRRGEGRESEKNSSSLERKGPFS